MIGFYYQIKAKKATADCSYYFDSPWSFPPIFSGKVKAENKKIAKQLIEEEYNREFPLRVLKKDIDSHDFLLHISEIKENDIRTQNLFENNICKECEGEFRTIDLYNDINEKYKGTEFCSWSCKEKHYSKNISTEPYKSYPKVIYKITNTVENKCYIGQTKQSFTLRWWQHFSNPNETKFHEAIKKHALIAWRFEIIEICENENELLERESYWIKHFDSIDSGYNSVISKKKEGLI